MSQKSTNSVKQTPSPIKPLPEETSKRFVPSSLMFSYFNDSHCYLNRKYSENNAIDFNHSNNFVRKDSLCVNNEETKDNEEDDMVNSEENESEDEEYGQLNANGVYNQQYINQDSNSKLPLFRFNLNQQFNLMTLNQIQQQQRPRFNSGNFTMLPNTFNFQPPYQVELPKKGGWVCSQCNNYNYNTRNKCNRCHAGRNAKKNKKNSDINSGSTQFNERVGDWKCSNCNNLNFSFRTVCNRCQLSKEDSDEMLMKYQMNNKEDINS